MKKGLLVFAVFIFLIPQSLWATHFRFGHLSWLPTGDQGEVEFHLVNAFRRNGYPGTAPDSRPQIGDIIQETIGGTALIFGDGTLTPTLRYVVTSYSVAQNYVIAEALHPGTTNRYIRHTYTSDGPYVAGISSCCRIDGTSGPSLNNRAYSNYRLETIVTPLSGNRSPVSSLFPVITVPETNNASFIVPAADPDGDALRWRISTDAEAGGGSSPPNLTIDSSTGNISWNTTGLASTNFWTVQVIIEDLDENSNALTRIPVDFLLLVSNSENQPPSCTVNPPGPVTAYIGSTVSFVVTGSDPDVGDVVTLNTGGLPAGASMTPGLPLTGEANAIVQSTFNWTPTSQQGGTYQLLFSAFDSFGFQALAPVMIHVAPLLIPGGVPTVSLETCLPTNGVVDPGETVTVNFPIRNTGRLPTTNTVGTLIASEGVTSPGGSQIYGAIPINGVVSRPFSFRANGPCGDSITATLVLSEGTIELARVNYQIRLGGSGTNQICCIDPSYIDLSLTTSDSPSPVVVGGLLSYSLNVINHGPATASDVTVTNILPSLANFVSATSSQATVSHSSGIVICNFGTLAPSQGGTVSITVQPYTTALLTNTASIAASQYDFNTRNNTATTITRAAAGLFISNGSIIEGNTGTSTLVFNVSTPTALDETVSVSFATGNLTATSADFMPTYGAVVFAPGVTNRTVLISINGDYRVEADETFRVTLSNPSANGLVVVSNGIGTIVNDDDVDYFLWSPIPNPQLVNEPFTATISAIGAGRLASNFNGTLLLAAFSGSGEEITIGSDTTTANYPLGTFYEDERTQVIYLASELGGSQRIKSLALNVSTAPPLLLNNWTIRMRHTTQTDYNTSRSWEGSDWTTVYQANQTVSTTGWVTFQLATPFDYNGTDNLMVDFSFNNSSYANDGYCYTSSTSDPRTIYYRTDSGYGDPLNWIGTTSPYPASANRILNLKLTVEAEPALNIIPGAASNFVNGIWFGEITVSQTGTNIVLQAIDSNGRKGFSNPFDVYPPGDIPPIIQQQPLSAFVGEGAYVTFHVVAGGTPPLSYQWHFNGTEIPYATSTTLAFTNVIADQQGAYSVTVSSPLGVAVSSNAFLTIDGFKILSLETNNSYVVDHNSVTGDDRGGIAASASQVFYTGDTSTARFSLGDLSGGTALGTRHDGLASDLKTETVYVLGEGSSPLGSLGGTVTTLLELDGSTGALTGNSITLSTPITLPYDSGVFSGYGRIVLHNDSQVYSIALPSGNVTDLGAMTMPSHRFSETWAFWGLAEWFDGAVHLVYVQDSMNIVRTRVPDGYTSPVAAFSYLNDMSAITVSIRSNRWYFHHENNSQFGGSTETIGFASASFLSPLESVHAMIDSGWKFKNNFSFSFSTEAGRTYILEYKETLGAADWTFLRSFHSTGDVINIIDTGATSDGRFYRMRVQ